MSLAASGCGGSSSSSSSPSSGGASSTFPSTSGPSGGGDVSAFCSEAKAQMNGLTAQLQPLMSGSSSPETVQKTLDTIDKAYQRVIVIAPAEIKGDLETLRGAVDKLKTAYSPGSDSAAAIAQLLPILSDQKLQNASEHLSQWASTHCGM
jgi:hypothetical protein